MAAELHGVDGVPEGVYYYDPASHRIGALPWLCESLRLAVEQPGGSPSITCRFWLMARFDRVAFKYGERGYRFVLMEAGHIAQNMLLIASALAKHARPYGGFLDENARAGLGVVDFDLDPLYYVAVG